MARTKRYRKSREVTSNVKSKPKRPLKRRYLRARQSGFEDPGDYCPDCGEPTGFQSGFLVCQSCGWIDSGPDSIELNFNVA